MENQTQGCAQTSAPKGGGKTRRNRKANMWYVISAALLGVFFTVALGIALKSSSLAGQFWWGIIATIFAILGLAALIQYYVIAPRVSVPPSPSSKPPLIRVVSAGIANVAVGQFPTSNITVENIGGEVARDFMIKTGVFMCPPPLGSIGEPQFYRSKTFTEESKIDLPIGMPGRANGILEGKLEEIDMVGIKLRKLVVYSYTKGQYSDQTGTPYIFEFCVFYDPDEPETVGVCSNYNSQRPLSTAVQKNQPVTTPLKFAVNKGKFEIGQRVSLDLKIHNNQDGDAQIEGQVVVVLVEKKVIPRDYAKAIPFKGTAPAREDWSFAIPTSIVLSKTKMKALKDERKYLFCYGRGSNKLPGGEGREFEFCLSYISEWGVFGDCASNPDPQNPQKDVP